MTTPSTVRTLIHTCQYIKFRKGDDLDADRRPGIPTLYHVDTAGEHTPIIPGRFSAYYIGIEHAEVAIPQDYQTVAGNASATDQSGVDDLTGVSWFCEGEANEDPPAAFPTKTCPTHIQTLLLFHDCVNDDTLESAYSGTQNWKDGFKPANRCPEGMKRMPQLRFSIRYDVREILPDGWSGTPPLTLASGNSFSHHGDFINGWLPEAAEDMLKCNDKREFRGVSGPNGDANAGSVCEGTAEDADPEHGTDDYEDSLVMQGKRRSAASVAKMSTCERRR